MEVGNIGMDSTPLPVESKEAVHKARDAAQAVEVARAAQIQEVADRVTENIPDESQMRDIIAKNMRETEIKLLESVTETMKAAFKFAFTTPEGEQRKFIDVTQLSRVCDDIAELKNGMVTKTDFLLMKQQSDLTNKIVMSAAAFIGVAFLTALTMLVYKQ